MKVIALIRDGDGRLHLDTTRAPDLLRREISHRTGDAQLCWCGVPPEGVAARAVVAEVETRLQTCLAGPGLLTAPAHVVIRHLLVLTLVEPALRAHCQRFFGLFRRARWSLRRLRSRIASFGGGR
jgi:hypothetical protein